MKARFEIKLNNSLYIGTGKTEEDIENSYNARFKEYGYDLDTANMKVSKTIENGPNMTIGEGVRMEHEPSIIYIIELRVYESYSNTMVYGLREFQ